MKLDEAVAAIVGALRDATYRALKIEYRGPGTLAAEEALRHARNEMIRYRLALAALTDANRAAAEQRDARIDARRRLRIEENAA